MRLLIIIALVAQIISLMASENEPERVDVPVYFPILQQGNGKPVLVGRILRINYESNRMQWDQVGNGMPEATIVRKYKLLGNNQMDLSSVFMPNSKLSDINRMLRLFAHEQTRSAIREAKKEFIGHLIIGGVRFIGVKMWKDEQLAPVFTDYLEYDPKAGWLLSAAVRTSDEIAIFANLAASEAAFDIITEDIIWSGVSFLNVVDPAIVNTSESSAWIGMASSVVSKNAKASIPAEIKAKIAEVARMYSLPQPADDIASHWVGGESWAGNVVPYPVLSNGAYEYKGYSELEHEHFILIEGNGSVDYLFIDKVSGKLSLFPIMTGDPAALTATRSASFQFFQHRMFLRVLFTNLLASN